MRLSEASKGRDNNLNLIRMLAALSVLISHAWPITLGADAVQPLKTVVGYNLGTLAVLVFFAISGFLVVRSYERQPSAGRWVMARVLRIFPGLAVMLLLTVLVLGPSVTTLPLPAYFGDPETQSYAIRNFFLVDRQGALPGVFETLPWPAEVNGSLWTLEYEVLCYSFVLAMGLIGAFRSRLRLALVAVAFVAVNGAAVAMPAEALPANSRTFLSLALPFACGVGFHLAQDRLPLSPWWLLALVLAAFALRGTPLHQPALVLALAYGVFVLAYLPGGWIRKYNLLGDYSYGIYIYACPVQQTVVQVLGPMGPLQNILVATPIVLVLAWLSWILVEKPALELVRSRKRA